jgi:hypothetical protein
MYICNVSGDNYTNILLKQDVSENNVYSYFQIYRNRTSAIKKELITLKHNQGVLESCDTTSTDTVVVPRFIVSIGPYAFKGTSVRRIVVPYSGKVELQDYCFANLKSVSEIMLLSDFLYGGKHVFENTPCIITLKC